MSGVGELVAGCAAAASISQLLVYAVKTGLAIATFVENAQQASSEFRAIRVKLIFLKHGLDDLRDYLNIIEDDNIIPPSFRVLLHGIIGEIHQTVIELQDGYPTANTISPRHRDRIVFALKDRKSLHDLLLRLRDLEISLVSTLTLLNLHISSATSSVLRGIASQVELTRSMIAQRSHPEVTDLNNTTRPTYQYRRLSQRKPPPDPKIPAKSYLLQENSWWRWFGFSYWSCLKFEADGKRRRSLNFGFRVPDWLLNWLPWNFVSFHYQISQSISYQKLVPLSLPFLAACKAGDMQLMAQYLQNDRELIHCRSICSGRTPLLLAIESGNLEAMRMLLDSGARTDIGDDQQILPTFAALGYRGQTQVAGRPSPFVQLPPKTDAWLDILRLLTECGASVHEMVGDRTITMLNLSSDNYAPQTTLRFFHLLREECYVDFNLVSDRGPSALVTAIRTRSSACAAIDFLADNGVSLQHIFEDGRTALHVAAEMASDAQPLKHLHDAWGIHEVNRQDQWGWTPLHYAVGSDARSASPANDKVAFLLDKGADPYISGRDVSFGRSHPSNLLHKAVSPMQYAKIFGDTVPQQLFRNFESNGGPDIIDEEVEEVYFDAEENIA